MINNKLMDEYLKKITDVNIISSKPYYIFKKSDKNAQPYWILDNDFDEVKGNLTDVEWNVNEIYFSGGEDIPSLLKRGLEVVSSWKVHLEKDVANTKFDIVLSIDCGDEEIEPSVTVRLYAVRKQEHYIIPSKEELEKFEQPILMEQVNYQL